MFSQKKKSYTWIYVCAGLAAAILLVLALIAAAAGRAETETIEAGLESKAIEQGQAEKQDTISEKEPEMHADQKSTEESQFYQSYYLVKYDNHVIRIYFSDETGNLIQLEETSIVYETLSAADQQSFAEGIRVNTRDDLNRLLMNYES